MPRFSPDFLDELKSRLRPSDIVGRHVKLRKQGAEWAGLSPFTNEKTPSFFVNDQKGFYHCFSSGKHGDVISFLQEVQGLSFLEAVTRLAEEAGLPLPADDPQAAKADGRRKSLVDALGAAAGFYRDNLRRAVGRDAFDYLSGRGVGEAAIDAFGIGYAPGSRAALKDYLINKGYAVDMLVEAGLLIAPEDGGAPYDRFRNRIMFPILGLKNDVIAFGGRALDPAARAKYLNSPETPVFNKGTVLYNYAAAREGAAQSGSPLIVCEGYMDVIALWRAGFRTAVAPLGTALTDRQIALLWRVSDEPILCFDGDAAGQRAANRAIDRAMPALTPGKSLQFAFLPEGQDPDDLLRTEGAAAIKTIFERTSPLAETLWAREAAARPLDTPERRAAFKARLRECVRVIADKDVRDAYGRHLAEKLAAAGAPRRPAFGGFPRDGASVGQRPSAFPGAGSGRGAVRARRDIGQSGQARERTLVLAAVRHPAIVLAEEAAVLSLELSDPDLQALLKAIIDAVFDEQRLDSGDLTSHLRKTLSADIMERLLADETLNRQNFLRSDAELDEVLRGWRDAYRHHQFATNLQWDLKEAAALAFIDGEDYWKAAVAARQALIAGGDDAADDEVDSPVNSAEADGLTSKLERMRRRFHGK